MEKVCNSCNVSKSVSEFNKNSKRKDGFSGKCKVCNKAYLREHYLKNKEYYSEKRRRTYRRYIEDFYNFLSGKSCKVCGISDIRVLEFDHLNDKSFNVSEKIGSMPLYNLMNEIDKCDILCANCHRIKTSEQFSWFKGSL